jgi:hypothetical protein
MNFVIIVCNIADEGAYMNMCTSSICYVFVWLLYTWHYFNVGMNGWIILKLQVVLNTVMSFQILYNMQNLTS